MPSALAAIESGRLEPIKESLPVVAIALRGVRRLRPGANPVPDSPSSPDDAVPDDFDNLMILSPEQYESLLKVREEQQRDLSRDQVDALLRALEERS